MLNIQKGVLLSNYSTFKIGGTAEYFTTVKHLNEIKEALQFAKQKEIPFFVLGGGSNVLFLDNGYPGLIIKFQSADEITIKPDTADGSSLKINANAGVPLNKLVNISLKKGFTGFEWAAGIPGQVGGAIYGNAGAFGASMADVVASVKALNIKSSTLDSQNFSNKDCQFSYRSSFFKENKNYIILEAEIKLKKGDQELIKDKIKENLIYRKERQPLEYPSVGSVFKNIPLTAANNQKLLLKFPDLQQFQEKGFIPVAYLIDECGLKGKKIGGAQVSEKHSNFIVNLGGARAEDVIILISLIKQKIRNKFGIELEEEIILVSDDTSLKNF